MTLFIFTRLSFIDMHLSLISYSVAHQWISDNSWMYGTFLSWLLMFLFSNILLKTCWIKNIALKYILRAYNINKVSKRWLLENIEAHKWVLLIVVEPCVMPSNLHAVQVKCTFVTYCNNYWNCKRVYFCFACYK